jgi:hypothetical protein
MSEEESQLYYIWHDRQTNPIRAFLDYPLVHVVEIYGPHSMDVLVWSDDNFTRWEQALTQDAAVRCWTRT